MKIMHLSLLLLFSNWAVSQTNVDYSKLIDSHKQKIVKVVNSGKVKGVAIALVDGDEIIWVESFGYSDFENKIKTDSNTIYGIGSVSKLFTGSAIMQLHEQNKLDIDKPVTVYSPEFRIKKRINSDKEITCRLLLNHHSGLPSDIGNGTFSMKPKPFNSVIELVEKEYAPYPPNYIFSYSNIGYSLLGITIENVSKLSYENYIKLNIFETLDMNSACFINDNSPKFSKGYDEKSELREEYGIRPIPAGAIKSNINDMAKFAMSFLPDYKGTRILERETIDKMLSKQKITPLDLGRKQGLSWFFERINSAGQIYVHTGGTLNHRSVMAIAPESNLGVVVLSNSVKSGSLHGIAMNLLDSCAIMKGRKAFETNKVTPVKEEIIKLSDKVLDSYMGIYANSAFILKVGKEGNDLTTKMQGRNYILTPLKDGSFLPQIALPNNKLHRLEDSRIEFEKIEGKDLLIFHNLTKNKRQILGSKFHPQKINNTWKARIGTYQIEEVNDLDFPMLAKLELAIDNGILNLRITEEYEGSFIWNPAIYIEDDNLGFPLGLGRHRGSTLLFERENGKEVLWYSGYKLSKIE